MEELVEVLSQWHVGRRISQIKRSVGIARKTIRKYIKMAQRCGFSRDVEIQHYQYYLKLAGKIQKELRAPLDSSPSYKNTTLYQSTIEKLLSKKYMTPKQVYRILKREYEYPLSYSSFNRYIKIKYPRKATGYVRIEVSAGEEAQVDFGGAGMIYDAEREDEEGSRLYHDSFILSSSLCRVCL